MKTFIFFFMVCLAVSSHAQDQSQQENIRLSVRNYALTGRNYLAPVSPADSLLMQSCLYKAGTRLKQSANYQFAALGSLAAGGIMLACYDDKKDSGDILKAGAILCGVAAFFFEYKSIDLKLKAGRELQIGAGSVVYRF